MNVAPIFLALLLSSTVLAAQPEGVCVGPTIRAAEPPYDTLGSLGGVQAGRTDEAATRESTMTKLAVAYRAEHGPRTLPTGTKFNVVWVDGSTDCGEVTSRTSSVQVKLVDVP